MARPVLHRPCCGWISPRPPRRRRASSPTSSTSIPLSIEDARSSIQFPKAEPYPGYLYVVLHGIDVRKGKHAFATRDIDFFIGPRYLVTVHDGEATSIAHLRELCDRHDRLLARARSACSTASSMPWSITTVR